jgi:regulator of sigma E protease
MSVLIAILGLAFLILVHEAGHFFTARAVGMRPRRFYVGFPPALVKTKRNGIEYGIGAIPLGGETCERGLREIEDGLAQDAYWRQNTWRRVAVIIAGPATNLVFAVLLFAGLFMAGGGKATTTVGQVLPDRPAAAIGLRPGDQIVAVNRIRVTPREIASRISESRGRPVTLLVHRGERVIALGPVRPRRIEGAYRLGFVLRGEKLGVGESAWQAVKLTGIVTREIGKSLARLVQGEGRKDIASPVGIGETLNTAQKEGTQTYLWEPGRHRPGVVERPQPGCRELPVGARADQPLAGADEPAAALASRRRTHRVLADRGSSGPSRRPRGLRASLRGRDCARRPAVLHRDFERHRQARR